MYYRNYQNDHCQNLSKTKHFELVEYLKGLIKLFPFIVKNLVAMHLKTNERTIYNGSSLS